MGEPRLERRKTLRKTWVAALPYTHSIVQLDEGVRVPTNIVESAPEDV